MAGALIIFVKNPIEGNVKTRIAATAGHAFAVSIYQQLLQHTHSITSTLPVAKFVFYGDFENAGDLWQPPYKKYLQQGNTLGERMKQAFATVFALGYTKVAIIGSDCYELTPAIIGQAFADLESLNVTIGPTFDGGYYLLGLRQSIPAIFDNIQWSTNTVFSDTLNFIVNNGYTYAALPKLHDVDTFEDCRRYPQLLQPI